jgi:hypothetical protein
VAAEANPLDTPEGQLLLSCARVHPTDEERSRIRSLLVGPLDMSAVLVTAYQQQVLPLLYRNLSTVCPEALPAALLVQLRQRSELQTRKNQALAEELVRFRDLLADHGIECVPLKGPAVAVGIYGDLSLRSFRDLDFLLLPKDIFRAKSLLAGLGYRIMPEISGARERSYLRSECEWSMGNPEDTACIEIHWAVRERCYRFPLTPEELWERRITVEIAGHPVRTLSREDLLLVLSVHGQKHCWDRLKWICDISELLRAPAPLDWDYLLRTARRLHAVRMLLVAVRLAEQLLQAPVPDEVALLLQKDADARQIAEVLRERLFNPPTDDLDSARRQRLYLQSRERVQDRLWYLFCQLTTPTERDWTEIPLPDWLFPAYHLIRPCRLAAGYAQSALKLAFQRSRGPENPTPKSAGT